MNTWQPNVDISILKLRAELLNSARNFFELHHCLEVDTPTLSQSTTPDPNIESFSTHFNNTTYYLHTSPEFPMKRLLAAGCGAIFQISKVFRQGEIGKNHNPEFTLIEWYQPGMYYHQLMQQLDELVRSLLRNYLNLNASVSFSYQELFENRVGLNPHHASVQQLQEVIEAKNIQLYKSEKSLSKDAYLDLIVTHLIQPALPKNAPVFIYDYPASQAALANIRHDVQPVAERFEMYINGIELANGYQELLDAKEQLERFIHDNSIRQQSAQKTIPADVNLISALEQGLPMVSGVALGFDRLLMLAAGKSAIRDVIAFTTDIA